MTIKNGSITYPGASSILWQWRPESDIFYEFTLAACTTVLIYQATAVLFDLLLGWRRKQTIRTSDLGIFMAMSDYSLQSTSSVFRQFKEDLRLAPEEIASVNPSAPGVLRNQRLTLAKLFILLSAIPTVKIMGVSLGLAHDRIVTFKQARFGGFSLGVGENPFRFVDGIPCKQMATEFGRREIGRTDFFLCWQGNMDEGEMVLQEVSEGKYEGETLALLFLGVTRESKVVLQFITQYLFMDETISANIRSDKKMYQVFHSLSVADGRDLMQKGLDEMLLNCPSDSIVAYLTDTNENLEWFLEVIVNCKNYTVEEAFSAISKVSGQISLTDSNKTDVVSYLDDEPKVLSVDDFPLLLRRESFVSLPILMIATMGIVFLRIFLYFFITDDAHIVVEMILKKRLEIPLGDSLLASNKTLLYGEKLETVMCSFSQGESETSSGYDEEVIEKPAQWKAECEPNAV